MASWGSKYRDNAERALRTAAQLVAGGGAGYQGSSGGAAYHGSRSGSGGGGGDVDDASRLLLRARADVFYRGLTGELKAMVDNGFAEADERRRGRISLPDLFKPSNSLGLRGPCDHDAITKLARFLDTNPNSDHLLSFPDYIVIAYLVTAGLRLCSSCSLPVIPMLGYSCRACWEMAAPSSPPAFDLCLPCYSSRRFPPHPHPPSSFIDQSILYTLMLHTSTQKTDADTVSTKTNVETMELQPHHQLQLAQMQMERQQAMMLANMIANSGAAVNALAPDSNHYTYTYIDKPFF